MLNQFFDRKFHKGGIPNVGDEIDFDSHIVTIESFETTEIANNTNQQTIPIQRQSNVVSEVPPQIPNLPSPPQQQPSSSSSSSSRYNQQPMRVSKFKPPSSTIPRKRVIKVDPEEMEDNDDLMEISEPPRSIQQQINQPSTSIETSIPQELINVSLQAQPLNPNMNQQSEVQAHQQQQSPIASSIPPLLPVTTPPSSSTATAMTTETLAPVKKRVRVGLSKRTSSTLHQAVNNTSTSLYTPPNSTFVNKPTASSFSKASNIPVEAINNNSTSSTIPQGHDNGNNGESSAVKPFKSPFAEGK